MNPEALLDTLLPELSEGLVACEPDGRIILFNRAAAEMLGRPEQLQPGSSLYDLCSRPPVEQALDLLQYKSSSKRKENGTGAIRFMNGVPGEDRFFRCRVCFLPSGAAAPGSFVVLFEDISAFHVPDSPLMLKIEQFRAPLANLQAAVENLTEYREMSPVMRSAFENVLVQESLNLTEAFTVLAGSCREIMQSHDPLTELAADMLFGYMAEHLRQKNIPVAAAPAPGVTVKVDIYGLMGVIDFLRANIARSQGEAGFSCETSVGGRFAYLDFIWAGPVMGAAVVEKMLEQELAHGVEKMTVAALLRAMDGDLWSQPHGEAKSMLRLALPVGDNGSRKS